MGIRIRAITNIKNWWRFWSIRLGALGTAVTGYLIASPNAALYVWNLLPPDLKAYIPPNYSAFIGVFIFVLGMASRLIKQDKLTNGTPKDDKL